MVPPRREGQEQMRTIHLRSSTQEVVGERSASLLEQRRHPSRLPLVLRTETSQARRSISCS